MKEIYISVVIPTYNRGQTLSKAIDSVLSQSHDYVQLIIIDDASTDHTLDILNSYDASYMDIICNQSNLGPSACRNLGIHNSKHRFIAFLDSDDEWHPDFLKSSLQLLIESNSPFCFCNYSVNDVNILPLQNTVSSFKQACSPYKFLLAGNFIALPSLLFDQQKCHNYLYFREDLPAYEDFDLLLRLLSALLIPSHLDQTLLHVFSSSAGVNSNQYNLLLSSLSIFHTHSTAIKSSSNLTLQWIKRLTRLSIASRQTISIALVFHLILIYFLRRLNRQFSRLIP